MKILGMLLIIGATTWIGFIYSFNFDRRPRQIRQLTNALQILETEIKYSQTPLDEAFWLIHNQVPAPTSDLFKKLTNHLTNELTNFVQLWSEVIEIHVKETSLQKQEKEILLQFGQTLGQHDVIQQEKHLLQTKTHLNHVLQEAIDERKRYSKAAKSLGLLMGLFIALLLM